MFEQYDEFEIALALYHWLQHNWENQGDPLYEAFCQLTEPGMFSPGLAGEYFENVDEATQMVYDELTRDNYEEALARVLNYKSEG